MKKLIILKLVILLAIIVSCCFGFFKCFNIKNDIVLMRLNVQKVKQDIKKANNDIEAAKENITKLKETKKDSMWEYDTWKRMKEKIEKALP